MRPPLSFVYENCVFATGLDDVWAAFRVATESYAWLGEEAKRRRMLALLSALEALEADVQLVRVASQHADRGGADDIVERSLGSVHGEAAHRHAEAQRARARDVGQCRPALFMFVSLGANQRDVREFVASQASRVDLRRLARTTWRELSKGRFPAVADLQRARSRAAQAEARLTTYLPARPVRGVELQWLVRRAFCRGLGEPRVDRAHEPGALACTDGPVSLAPLEGEVMRWADGIVRPGARCLRIESELGMSWQAHLVLGALPESTVFPGPGAELMFAPGESLPFAVDVSLNARFLANDVAVRLVRRRIQDADQIVRAESEGEQGVSDLGYERATEARELLARLQTAGRPSLLRCSLAVAVAARSRDELEARVERVRRAFGEVAVHRPPGEQLELFLQHLPAQRTRVHGYDGVLTCEQVAAMMPTATHAVGSRRGYYLGYTLSGSRQAVRFSVREGSDSDRNATILCIGSLGSGKTTLAQKLQYEAFLQGARIVDCDPKGDHRFHELADVAPHVERITLAPDPALRGILDPLCVAPAHLRHEAAVSFLCDLLPAGADASWEMAIVAAVERVVARASWPTCGEVVTALSEGDERDREVARALVVFARAGLTQLGFADTAAGRRHVAERQVTYLPIRDLPGPEPGVSRSEYSRVERVGAQIVRLIAMFAMHLMGSERARLKVFAFDEGWRLLGDPVGRSLLAGLQRMGRSELAVPIISTQLLSDALIGERESLEDLVGATFVFRMRSDREAARALALLGLDPDDAGMRRALLELDSGCCLLRDHRGRIEAVRIDVLPPSLLSALSTTPAVA